MSQSIRMRASRSSRRWIVIRSWPPTAKTRSVSGVDDRDSERQPEKQYRQPTSGHDALDRLEIPFTTCRRWPWHPSSAPFQTHGVYRHLFPPSRFVLDIVVTAICACDRKKYAQSKRACAISALVSLPLTWRWSVVTYTDMGATWAYRWAAFLSSSSTEEVRHLHWRH